MTFEKGKPRPENAGRRPGTVNVRTMLLKRFLEAENVNVVQQLVALIPDLSPEMQAKVWLGLMPYLFPRLSSITVEKTPEQEELEKLTTDELINRARPIIEAKVTPHEQEKPKASRATTKPRGKPDDA